MTLPTTTPQSVKSVGRVEPITTSSESKIECTQQSDQPANDPEGATADSSTVSTLVTKSKKAASSLFTLLHAKNCKLGVQRCPHPGCAEAKLIFLHLKTSNCDASNVGPCPTHHKGCTDARKLLNHYRRCREIRSRQVANRCKEPQHICLVCSLVARYAKGSIDRNRSISPNIGRTSHLIPSLNLSTDEKNGVTNQLRHRSRSTSPHRGDMGESPLKMPPPPPKFAFANKAEKPGMTVSFHLDPVREIPDRAHEGDIKYRPRSESLEIHRSSRDSDWYLAKSSSDPGAFSTRNHGDETKELEDQPIVRGRRRSASYSVPSSSSLGPTFDPILEEPVGQELQRILEGDS